MALDGTNMKFSIVEFDLDLPALTILTDANVLAASGVALRAFGAFDPPGEYCF